MPSMRKKLPLLCTCLVVLFASRALAQGDTGSIRGTVRDASSGETLPNASVVVDSLHIGATTDKSGYYIIGRLPTGQHRITFSYVGYETKTQRINLSPDEAIHNNVELDPSTIEIDGIESVAKRVSPTDITPVGSFGTRVTELARIPAVGQPDLMRGIQLLPGVQASSDNSAGIYVRGGTPGQNLILLDDVVVYNPNHLFGFFSTFNPDALKDVLLLKGTFPARYGDRLSSVLDITNLDGNRKRFNARASVDLISAGLTVEGPLPGNGSWMVSSRTTYQKLLNSPLFGHIVDDMFATRTGTFTPAGGGTGGPSGPGGMGGGMAGLRGRFGRGQFNWTQTTSDFGQDYGFYDTNFKVNLETSSSDRISLSGYFGNDGLNLNLPSFRETQRQQLMNWGNQIGRLRWTRVYTDNFIGNVQFCASRYVSNFDVAGDEAQSSDQRRGFSLNRNNRLMDLTFKADFDYYITTAHTTKIGAQITRYDATYMQGMGDTTRSGVNTVSAYETGYLEHTWRMGGLELVPGLRASHFQSGNYSNISPRVSGRYHVNDKVAFKGGWGIYHQYLNLISVEGFSYTTDMWLPVDETLEPGRAVHRAAGMMLTPSDEWSVDVEFYHKSLSNLVEFQSQVRLDNNAPLSDLFLQGTGRAYGGELFLRRTAGRTTGWIGYTLGWTYQTFPEINKGEEFSPKYDRRHDLSVVLNHDLGRGWNTNLTWVYGTGQAYTIPESRYTVVQPGGQAISYVHVSEKNAYRLPAYHRMDLGLTRDFHTGRYSGQFVISLFNVYNRRNIWYRTYDATEEEIQFQDVLLQPFLPSIGFKFNM